MVAPAEYVFPIKQNIEAAAAAGRFVEKLLLGNTNIGKIHQSGSNKLPKDKLLVWLLLVFSNFCINVCPYFDIRYENDILERHPLVKSLLVKNKKL